MRRSTNAFSPVRFGREAARVDRSAARPSPRRGSVLDLTPHDWLASSARTAEQSSLIRQFNERHREKQDAIACASYLKNGYGGFVALSNAEPVGYWWWVDNRIETTLTHPCIERLGLRLKDDEVYGFDYFVAPEYRDHGVGVKFLSLIYRELRKRGYRRVWAFVDAGNLPARWVYKAHGNKVVRRIVSHQLFSALLLQDQRVFIRNTKSHSPHAFDYRLLLSLKRAPNEIAGLMTHGV